MARSGMREWSSPDFAALHPATLANPRCELWATLFAPKLIKEFIVGEPTFVGALLDGCADCLAYALFQVVPIDQVGIKARRWFDCHDMKIISDFAYVQSGLRLLPKPRGVGFRLRN